MTVFTTPSIVLTTALLLLLPVSSLAGERAGEATRVQPDSYQRDGFFPTWLEVGDEIVSEARVYTEDYGSLELRFDDGSTMTLGPNSEIVIDEYVYAPAASTGKATIRLGKGLLRMVSGSMPAESYAVRTPVATIGIRGTDFTLDTAAPETVRIWVDDGTVVAQPLQGAQAISLTAPAFAVCSASGCEQSDGQDRPIAFPPPPPSGFDNERDDGGGGGDGGGSD